MGLIHVCLVGLRGVGIHPVPHPRFPLLLGLPLVVGRTDCWATSPHPKASWSPKGPLGADSLTCTPPQVAEAQWLEVWGAALMNEM